MSDMASPKRPHYIPLPPPLRSAMKHSLSSRPGTPNQGISSSPLSPPIGPIPLSPLTTSALLSSPTNGPTSPYSSANPSSSAVTFGSPHTTPSPLVVGPGYTPKVSFDTLENPQASMFSYTLPAPLPTPVPSLSRFVPLPLSLTRSWLAESVASIGQAVATAQRTPWFAIFVQLFLILGVLHTLATDSITMHRFQIAMFGSIAIVFAVDAVNEGIFTGSAALDAMATGWLILAMVDIRHTH